MNDKALETREGPVRARKTRFHMQWFQKLTLLHRLHTVTVRSPRSAQAMFDIHSLLCGIHVCNLGQLELEEIWALVVA